MRDSSIVLFVPFGDRIKHLLIHTDPLLQVLDALFVATPLLYVVGFALLEGDCEPARNGSKRVGVDVVIGMTVEDGEG
jgi:hypothetical protein